MKVIKSKSGRKVLLQDHTTPTDFNGPYQRELIESYDTRRVDKVFSEITKIVVAITLTFFAIVLIKHFF